MNVAKAGGNGGGWANLNCGSTDGQAGSWFDSLPTFQNGVAPFKYSFAWGSLPAGLSLDTASGAITGVPVGGGWTDFVLQVQDSLGNGDRQYCHLNIANQPAIQYTPTDDPYGHGTHVAGILGSSGDGSVYIGMAPNVNLINLRVLDHNGHGTDATVIQAIDKAIELSKTYNIRVINLSLGREVFEPAAQDPLCQAVEAAWKAGIVVVAAAGNDGRDNSLGNKGYGTIAAPGNDPYVITVGAMKTMGTITRSDDLIASYSAKGPTAFDHFAKPAMLCLAAFQVIGGAKAAWVGLVGDDAYITRFGTGAVQRALRARQLLDARDIIDVDVEHTANGGNRDFVEIEAGGRLGPGMVDHAA